MDPAPHRRLNATRAAHRMLGLLVVGLGLVLGDSGTTDRPASWVRGCAEHDSKRRFNELQPLSLENDLLDQKPVAAAANAAVCCCWW